MGQSSVLLNDFIKEGEVFARHGWVFFGPYRRGQGLSASAGRYIGDETAEAKKRVA